MKLLEEVACRGYCTESVLCDVICVVCRFLQADGAEQEGVYVCRQRGVSGEQGAEETLSSLSLQEVSQCWNETGRWDVCSYIYLSFPCALLGWRFDLVVTRWPR